MTLPLEQPRDPWSPRPIDLPRTVPLRGRFSTSLPGYDGATVRALAQRTLALAEEPSRA